ncbi:hypothetical protein KN1_01710 [Stygiolobus caldivivus]|uniref:Uncharacterized protein n=1 Tax=Stygiolobus caldivivus TaxID=2824673 RepID=A0A8D5U4M6_9CREN|nr:hypothetical protein KN1_01710 [Stygiolobus caldivivus]
MEKDLYKVGGEYVEARAIERLSDLILSLTLWKEGDTLGILQEEHLAL